MGDCPVSHLKHLADALAQPGCSPGGRKRARQTGRADSFAGAARLEVVGRCLWLVSPTQVADCEVLLLCHRGQNEQSSPASKLTSPRANSTRPTRAVEVVPLTGMRSSTAESGWAGS